MSAPACFKLFPEAKAPPNTKEPEMNYHFGFSIRDPVQAGTFFLQEGNPLAFIHVMGMVLHEAPAANAGDDKSQHGNHQE